MTGVRITIDTGRLESYYERVMDEIFTRFHYHPLSFQGGKISPDELARMNEYQSMARAMMSGDSAGIARAARNFDPAINPKFKNIKRTGR